MTRRKISSLSKFETTDFASIQSFKEAVVPPGVLTINYNDLPLDILNIDRGSANTLVIFHSSLSPRMQTLPVFSGQQLSSDLNMNLISLSDPSLVLDDNLNLTWFLGNRKQDLIATLPGIIEHVLASHRGARPIYFGASGGGFAALLYSRNNADAITIVANPRIDLGAPPMQDLGPYLRQCFGVAGRTPALRIMRENIVMRMQSLYKEGNSNKVLYVQNFRDGPYMRNNMMPFVEIMANNPKFSLCLADFGVGHRPIPGEILRKIISGVIQDPHSSDANLLKLGFKTAPSLAEVEQWSSQLLGI